jgi:hypothetical protein
VQRGSTKSCREDRDEGQERGQTEQDEQADDGLAMDGAPPGTNFTIVRRRRGKPAADGAGSTGTG